MCALIRVPLSAQVIEYLGELIRQRLGDLREKRYEDSGTSSCYMVRRLFPRTNSS